MLITEQRESCNMTDTEVRIHAGKILAQLETSGLSGMEAVHVLSSTASNLLLGMIEMAVVEEEERNEFKQDLHNFSKTITESIDVNNTDVSIAMLTFALLLKEYSFVGIADEKDMLNHLFKKNLAQAEE